MGLIHTPRVFASIAGGIRQRASAPKGVGVLTPHKYRARLGLFDVDYLGHMNNAAYLSHAEYARWQMGGAMGMLQAVYQHKVDMIIASNTVRYRAEVRPLFQQFEIQTRVCGMTDKHLYIYHTFHHLTEGDDRVRAQVLAKAAMVENRKTIDPRSFFQERMGLSSNEIEAISLPSDNVSMDAMIDHYEELEVSLRELAAKDDETRS